MSWDELDELAEEEVAVVSGGGASNVFDLQGYCKNGPVNV